MLLMGVFLMGPFTRLCKTDKANSGQWPIEVGNGHRSTEGAPSWRALLVVAMLLWLHPRLSNVNALSFTNCLYLSKEPHRETKAAK